MFATAVGADEQEVAPVEGDTAQRSFGGGVNNLDGAVVALARQRRPQVQGIQDGCRRVRLAGPLFQRGAQPAVQVLE